MVVSYMRVDLTLPGARSLKDKRAVLRSLTDKIRHDYRVSIAEVEDQELWGNATLGVALATNDPSFGETVLRKVLEVVESRPELEVQGTLIDDIRV